MKTTILIISLLGATLFFTSCGKNNELAPQELSETSVAPQEDIKHANPKEDVNQLMIDPVRNYPDPFTESTTIEFQIWESAKVSLVVFNEKNERIALLVGQALEKGDYSVKFDAKNLPAGKYYARLQMGSTKITEVMTKVHSTQVTDPGFE
jgi:hypothetical protein